MIDVRGMHGRHAELDHLEARRRLEHAVADPRRLQHAVAGLHARTARPGPRRPRGPSPCSSRSSGTGSRGSARSRGPGRRRGSGCATRCSGRPGDPGSGRGTACRRGRCATPASPARTTTIRGARRRYVVGIDGRHPLPARTSRTRVACPLNDATAGSSAGKIVSRPKPEPREQRHRPIEIGAEQHLVARVLHALGRAGSSLGHRGSIAQRGAEITAAAFRSARRPRSRWSPTRRRRRRACPSSPAGAACRTGPRRR